VVLEILHQLHHHKEIMAQMVLVATQMLAVEAERLLPQGL
jgi:hypothetical protein